MGKEAVLSSEDGKKQIIVASSSDTNARIIKRRLGKKATHCINADQLREKLDRGNGSFTHIIIDETSDPENLDPAIIREIIAEKRPKLGIVLLKEGDQFEEITTRKTDLESLLTPDLTSTPPGLRKDVISTHPLYIFTGPTGSGKTTHLDYLRQMGSVRVPLRYSTRNTRDGEILQRNLSFSEFRDYIDSGIIVASHIGFDTNHMYGWGSELLDALDEGPCALQVKNFLALGRIKEELRSIKNKHIPIYSICCMTDSGSSIERAIFERGDDVSDSEVINRSAKIRREVSLFQDNLHNFNCVIPTNTRTIDSALLILQTFFKQTQTWPFVGLDDYVVSRITNSRSDKPSGRYCQIPQPVINEYASSSPKGEVKYLLDELLTDIRIVYTFRSEDPHKYSIFLSDTGMIQPEYIAKDARNVLLDLIVKAVDLPVIRRNNNPGFQNVSQFSGLKLGENILIDDGLMYSSGESGKDAYQVYIGFIKGVVTGDNIKAHKINASYISDPILKRFE